MTQAYGLRHSDLCNNIIHTVKIFNDYLK